MIVFPNSKINIGLNIRSKRPDGFHELHSCFYPLALSDCLEIIPSPTGRNLFNTSGLPIPHDESGNLCEKAHKLMQEHYDIPAVQMHLHKAVPIGAGLGGGSADAAFTLRLLSEMFCPDIPEDALYRIASQLGSDCAFFLLNKPCIASGRGEILNPISLSLAGYTLLLIMPPIHISTKEAYAGIKPHKPQSELSDNLQQDISSWKSTIENDFEKGIFASHNRIAQIKEKLYELGAEYASMSGSGAAVYGIFKAFTHQQPEVLFPDCFIWKEKLSI